MKMPYHFFRGAGTRWACLLFALATSLPAHAGDLVAGHAWIQESPPGLSVLAGYLDLENRGDHDIKITRISSTVAERIEVHRTEIDTNTVTMRRIPVLELKPHSRLDFKPGGYHLMIFGVTKPLHVGDKVRIDIATDAGSHVLVDAVVRKSGDDEADKPDSPEQP